MSRVMDAPTAADFTAAEELVTKLEPEYTVQRAGWCLLVKAQGHAAMRYVAVRSILEAADPCGYVRACFR